ncbi:MAG: TIGR03790 family protein [Burkholderiales bacterium]
MRDHQLSRNDAAPERLAAAAIRAICGCICCAALLMAPAARALDHSQVAVIINTRDALSVEIGEYYAAQRHLLFQNIIRIGFPAGKTAFTAKEFAALKSWIDEKTVAGVEAYVLTWAAPYRVECMSITAALAFGFDPAYCAEGCKPTRPSPYFNSPSRLPFTQLGMRPVMSLAATSFKQAKALIDRGVESDSTRPAGTAYLLSTSDSARNVRSASYPLVEKMLVKRLRMKRLQQDELKDAADVLFYFTGRVTVADLDTLRFVPGAIADHVTSAGGQLTDSSQMSALRWLEAGATGSYGTVVEPCNMVEKFPHLPVVIGRYLQGETLIEAYWKSVLMPGQGIFIGEPLARPFQPLPPR